MDDIKLLLLKIWLVRYWFVAHSFSTLFCAYYLWKIWKTSPAAVFGFVGGSGLTILSLLAFMDQKSSLSPWFPLWSTLLVLSSFAVAFGLSYAGCRLLYSRRIVRLRAA